jgi:hypothetical protein
MSVAQRVAVFAADKSPKSASKLGEPKFKVGDRVRRSPKWWPKSNPYNIGTIKETKIDRDDRNRMVHTYRIIADPDKKGEMNFFTNKMEPAKGTWYTEEELVPLKK